MNMGSSANVSGELSVPPGFRFHPTDEELLYYYLRKKVSYEPIDLDVIREVDLNKLEPWELKEKCRIGSGPQNDWFFFSHKDKKYPTGTRTNRATQAGFWKATGRDKAIHMGGHSKRIGMRKTLVFYTGRAPHGQKTEWIMHEYRLEEDNTEIQEDGWVVCRVFKKKNHHRGFHQEVSSHHDQEDHLNINMMNPAHQPCPSPFDPRQNNNQLLSLYEYNLDGSMNLPQLFSPETGPSFLTTPLSLNTMDLECSHNLLRLTSPAQHERYNGDWSFLDKLLAAHQHNQVIQNQIDSKPTDQVVDLGNSGAPKFPFQYLGHETDFFKFSKQ